NVIMVVPVLMTSCHVSENPKTGPVAPHTTIVARATANAHEPPVHSVTRRASASSALPTPSLERSPLIIAYPLRHAASHSLPTRLVGSSIHCPIHPSQSIPATKVLRNKLKRDRAGFSEMVPRAVGIVTRMTPPSRPDRSIANTISIRGAFDHRRG